jgi:hypothetical protein
VDKRVDSGWPADWIPDVDDLRRHLRPPLGKGLGDIFAAYVLDQAHEFAG